MMKKCVSTTVTISPHSLKPWSAVWLAWEGRVTCVLQAVKAVKVLAACYPHCPVVIKQKVSLSHRICPIILLWTDCKKKKV